MTEVRRDILAKMFMSQKLTGAGSIMRNGIMRYTVLQIKKYWLHTSICQIYHCIQRTRLYISDTKKLELFFYLFCRMVWEIINYCLVMNS